MKIACWRFYIKHLLLFELCAREIYEKFIYKHSETIYYVSKHSETIEYVYKHSETIEYVYKHSETIEYV